MKRLLFTVLVLFYCHSVEIDPILRGRWAGYPKKSPFGFLLRIDQQKLRMSDPSIHPVHMIEADYKIEGSLIIVEDPPRLISDQDLAVDTIKIIKASQDSLIIFEPSFYNDTLFLRKVVPNHSRNLTRIQASHRGDWAPEKAFDLEIRSDETFIFNAIRNYTFSGYFQGRLKKGYFEKLRTNYQDHHLEYPESVIPPHTTDGGDYWALKFFYNDTAEVMDLQSLLGPIDLYKIFRALRRLSVDIDSSGEYSLVEIDTSILFESRLIFAKNLSDTIRYLETIDSINFRSATFLTGKSELEKIIRESFNQEALNSELEKLPLTLVVELAISKEGRVESVQFHENSYRQYSKQFKDELTRIVISAPKWNSAIYDGSAVSVVETVVISLPKI